MLLKRNVSLADLIFALAEAVDLVSPELSNHHFKVASTAFRLAEAMKLPQKNKNNILIAGALHDIGALSLKERLELKEFEVDNPYSHANIGAHLLRGFDPLADVSTIIKYHHTNWDNGNGSRVSGEAVPIESHVIHLADRIAVSIDENIEILEQSEHIKEKCILRRGVTFHPEVVDAFNRLSSKESFWFELNDSDSELVRNLSKNIYAAEINLDNLHHLTKIYAHIIDFRSTFLATHSVGVAVVSGELARIAGFSEKEAQLFEITGYLHDIGKLAVPSEILEKPEALTRKEFNIIKKHTYYTFKILSKVDTTGRLALIASSHHERMDGGGYPLRTTHENLSLAAKIVTVADIFTALTEDRPYRKGMDSFTALRILDEMVDDGAIDGKIVNLLKSNFDSINNLRMESQGTASELFSEINMF